MIYWKLFWTFLKIGAFTFGGGYAMLALMQSEAAANGWMDTATLVDFVAVSESTPGPLAVNMATYVGAELGGLPGALCATLGVVLPSFLVILLVAKCYGRFQSSLVVKGCMSGLKPAVVGLIGAAVISVGTAALFPKGLCLDAGFWTSLGIFVGAAILAFKRVHPIVIICLSGGVGIAAGYLGAFS